MKPTSQWIKQHKVAAALSVLIVVAVMTVLGVRSKQADADTLSEPLRKGPIVESVYGIGTVTAAHSFQLKSGVASVIRQLYVREGDQVQRGQRLAQLDDGASFTAPFDATVTLAPFKVGEKVFPQSVILSLVDLADRYLVVSLEQRGALRVRRGQKAKINFDSMRAESYDGVVESVYSQDNNFLVRIGVKSLPSQVLPGMTADVAITVAERRDVLSIPTAAIEAGKVYVKRGAGRPDEVTVKLGVVDGESAEVVAGDVREGERLVIRKRVSK